MIYLIFDNSPLEVIYQISAVLGAVFGLTVVAIGWIIDTRDPYAGTMTIQEDLRIFVAGVVIIIFGLFQSVLILIVVFLVRIAIRFLSIWIKDIRETIRLTIKKLD